MGSLKTDFVAVLKLNRICISAAEPNYNKRRGVHPIRP
jgi:hypothetical protein